MKKIGILILGLCSIFLVGNFTQAKDYEYTNLNITANILEDGTIDVKEDFSVDFFVDKHGIIRTIPLNYSVEGKDFHIKVSNIDVEGKKFKTSRTNKEREIKIGDAKKVVNGRQNYSISYSTYGLIRNFSGMGYAELYWNLVGYDFDTNINQVIAELILPKIYTGFSAEDFLITTDGTTKTIDGFAGIVNRSKGDRIIITYDKGLPAYQGITLAIKFPNDYFEFDHGKQKKLIGKYSENIIKVIFKKYLGFLGTILLIGFLVCVILDIRKNIQQRNIRKKYPVIIQYSAPKGMSPSEVGVLYNRCVKPSLIVSLIYQRATEGYISFEKKWWTTKIIKNKELDIVKKSKTTGSKSKKHEIIEPSFENDTRKALFHGKETVSLPSEEFNLQLTDLEDDLYSTCLKKKRFEKSGQHNSLTSNQNFSDTYLGKFAIITVILLFISLTSENGQLFLRSFGMGLIAILTLFILPTKKRLTDKGHELLSHIKGYRQFIKSCDANKIRLFLKDDPLFVDKTLPYAVALGLETKFMKNFKPIAKEMGITSNIYDVKLVQSLNDRIYNYTPDRGGSGSSSYSSSSGFSGGSSFSGGGSSFSSGGGGGGGGGRSW